jgi:osmotically-inducible protein OsmY
MVTMREMTMDERVQRDVLDELHWDSIVKPTEVGVEVNDGIVTLTGKVDSYHKRREAAEAALRVYGVRGVVNDVDVKTTPHSPTDTEIAGMVADTLRWDTSVPDDRVKVRVSDGWVTLEGMVDFRFQQRTAEEAIRRLSGVRGVSNLLEVKHETVPKLSAEGLKSAIERSFTRSAEIDARRIGVSVHNHTVTLSGHLSSWAELHRAEAAARSAPGVRSVTNNLIVQP